MSLTFLSPWVLLGLASLAIPIVIHLILRRKPKHQMFPAFRFLRQRRRTNLRKLQLRHLLLLALRMLLLAAFAFALARPLLSGGPSELAGNPDLAVLLLFDSSPSMNYLQDGKSRLELAKELGGSIIDNLTLGSQIAVLDTGEAGGKFMPPGDARRLVGSRRILPKNRPVTAGLEDAYRLLEKAAPSMPLLMCVFSDRTAASWDPEAASLLAKLPDLETKLKRKLKIVYIDLGVAQPRNIAVTGISLRTSGGTATPLEELRLGATGRTPVQFQAAVEVTGASINNEVLLYIDGKLHDQQSLQVSADPGQTVKRLVTFKSLVFPSSQHSGEVKLRSADALEDDNQRWWTLQVSRRKALVIADDPADALDWKIALEALEDKLPVEVKVLRPSECPATLTPEQFQAVCLLNVARPNQALWETLEKYVAVGGGLVLLPGADCDMANWNTPAALSVSPARIKGQRAAPAPGAFMAPDYSHPMMARFKTWEQPITPAVVYRYWELEPLGGGQSVVIAPYSDGNRPALVERLFDRKKSLGRVVMFSTLMYRRGGRDWKDWNNFLEESGGAGWIAALALPFLSVEHVLGARGEPTNFILGDELRLLLPSGQKLTEYRLSGPQSGSGKILPGSTFLSLSEIAKPGDYKVADLQGDKWSAAFSVNLSPRETQLVLNKPSIDQIQETLGPESVKPWSEELDVRKMVRDKFGLAQETDLLPLVMLLCLLVLAAENFLANRFYRSEPEGSP